MNTWWSASGWPPRSKPGSPRQPLTWLLSASVRLLDGYGDAELQWLATALRRALGTPAVV